MDVQWTQKRNDLYGSRWLVWEKDYKNQNFIRWSEFKDGVIRMNPHLNQYSRWLFIKGEYYIMPEPKSDINTSQNNESYKTYTIRPNDTIGKIAKRNKTTIEKIQSYNPQIKNINIIFPGQVIYIPVINNNDSCIMIDEYSYSDIPWFEIAKHEMECDIMEEYGPYNNNPRIIEYHKSTTLNQNNLTDEIPWCSSFVNWCMKMADIEGTNSARAKSWENWGDSLSQPLTGCIAVLTRSSNPEKGHVGFFCDETENYIKLLGGNQKNRVKISNYRKDRLVSYRWPSDSGVYG